MLKITNRLQILENEIEMSAIRAQGAGGQNVNKVATAIHLRFDIRASSLPDTCKDRLLKLRDKRLSDEGVIIIKAQSFRSQEKNRQDARERLRAMILSTLKERKARKATRPTRSSQRKRVDKKVHRGRVKSLRGKVDL